MIILQILTSLIFLGSLYIIFTEKMNRTIVALAGAGLMVLLGKIFGFYSEEQALHSVDFNTLGLLVGMMILVALLEPTGFFQYLAVRVGKMSQGRPLRLLVLLGAVTTVLSLFLNNVTTVILIAPVTILICEILGISPLPYLMSEALLSDVGGVATLIGDPPNILVASAAGFNFNDFLIHSLPIIFVTWLVSLALMRYLFRKELSEKPANTTAIMELNPSEALTDPRSAKKVLIVIGGTLVLFMFEELLNISPSLIALIGATLALVLVQPKIEEILKLIDWSVLTFFAALFVMIGGLESAGVMNILSNILLSTTHLPPLLFNLGLLWIVAILSAVIDNVPITIAIIPIIQQLGSRGVDITPIWWALVFGAGLGGNGTIIGSTANIVVASLSERTHSPITPTVWNKRGLPVMIVTCVVVSILYALVTLTTGW